MHVHVFNLDFWWIENSRVNVSILYHLLKLNVLYFVWKWAQMDKSCESYNNSKFKWHVHDQSADIKLVGGFFDMDSQIQI